MFRHCPAALAALLCLVPFAVAQRAAAGVPPEATSSRAFQPGAPLAVALYDRTAGRMLPLHWHRGEIYAAGEPGHEYEIRLRNAGDGRVLAVTSIDGVNVVTGRTAATDQPGYVVGRWGAAHIDGWRKSLGEVAAFRFTRLRQSYAARTGRPDHVGVIGVAMFREATRVASLPRAPYTATHDERADAPSAGAHERAAPARPSAGSDEAAQRRSNAAADMRAAAPELGTGHGARHGSPVEHTTFERVGDAPDTILRIYYDSRRNLVARGVIEAEPAVAQRRPEPFPAGGFVPDP